MRKDKSILLSSPKALKDGYKGGYGALTVGARKAVGGKLVRGQGSLR